MAIYAMITGINYYADPDNALRGCINDAYDFEKLCLDNGVPKENITMVTDDPAKKGIHVYPNKKDILEQLDILRAKAQPGDTVFITYSGHGTYSRDTAKIETDGKSEATYTADGQLITDKEFYERVAKVKNGVKVAVVMDCCHSASMLNLFNSIDGPATKLKDNKNHGYVVMLSGCQDNQTSADALLRGLKKKEEKRGGHGEYEAEGKREIFSDDKGVRRYRGALTAAFMETVGKKGLKSILETAFSGQLVLMRQVRDTLLKWLKAGGFDQIPSISYEGTLPKQVREVEPQQPIVVAFDRSRLRQRGADGRVAKAEPEARKKATLK